MALTAADTAPISIILTPVTELPAVVTKADSSANFLSPALRGFEERRRMGTAAISSMAWNARRSANGLSRRRSLDPADAS
ncbi:MAG TPA: hypothetical protein VGM50_17785 [Gemmatimonadaceae bacterium]